MSRHVQRIRRAYGKAVSALIDEAIADGAEIVLTKAGIRIRFPDGLGSVCLHASPSDRRAGKNAAAQIKRYLI